MFEIRKPQKLNLIPNFSDSQWTNH